MKIEFGRQFDIMHLFQLPSVFGIGDRKKGRIFDRNFGARKNKPQDFGQDDAHDASMANDQQMLALRLSRNVLVQKAEDALLDRFARLDACKKRVEKMKTPTEALPVKSPQSLARRRRSRMISALRGPMMI